MGTTLKALKAITTTEKIKDFAAVMIHQLKEGQIDIAETFAQIKVLESIFDKVKKECKELFIEKAEELKGDVYHGFKWCVQERTIEKVFSGCGHSTLLNLYRDKEALEERIKAIENSLMSMSADAPIFDPNTGEICHKPVIKKSLIISLTKK